MKNTRPDKTLRRLATIDLRLRRLRGWSLSAAQSGVLREIVASLATQQELVDRTVEITTRRHAACRELRKIPGVGAHLAVQIAACLPDIRSKPRFRTWLTRTRLRMQPPHSCPPAPLLLPTVARQFGRSVWRHRKIETALGNQLDHRAQKLRQSFPADSPKQLTDRRATMAATLALRHVYETLWHRTFGTPPRRRDRASRRVKKHAQSP